MKTSLTYGFIGAGQMGEAIFAGLLRKKLARPADVHIADVDFARANAMREKYGIAVGTSASAVVAAAHLVVLATKPQDLDALLRSLPPTVVTNRLFVSIAAGKSLSTLEALLPGARIVRVMPNLAMRVGEGMSCMAFGDGVTEEDRTVAMSLFQCSGKVIELPEALFDAVTALSGSGPAFFAILLQAFAKGAVSLGIPTKAALTLATQTMLGTAHVVAKEIHDHEMDTIIRTMDEKEMPDRAGGSRSSLKKPPAGCDSLLANFIEQVTSKGGTTAAGRDVLERKYHVEGVIDETLRAAAARSKELATT